MVLKTGTVKEPKKEKLPVLWSDWSPTDGRTDNVINNLIIIYLNYINN